MRSLSALLKDPRAWVAVLLLAIGAWLFLTAPAAREWRGLYWPLGAGLVLAGVPHLLAALGASADAESKRRAALDETRRVCLLAITTYDATAAVTAIHALRFHANMITPGDARELLEAARRDYGHRDLVVAFEHQVNRLCIALGQEPLYPDAIPRP